jgi:L-serine dehydratase
MAYGTFAELVEAATCEHASLGETAIARECTETGAKRAAVLGRLEDALLVMEEAVAEGMRGEIRSRSGLVGGDARKVTEAGPRIAGDLLTETLAAALAVAEVNASMGRVVAAPTGGASGVLPAVLLTVARRLGSPRDTVVLALAAAGAVGGVIAARAALSGAAAGCQAEIGAAASMAAAAATDLSGTPPRSPYRD